MASDSTVIAHFRTGGTFKLRNGRAVKVYEDHGNRLYGRAETSDGSWTPICWSIIDGRLVGSYRAEDPYDLIVVHPPFKARAVGALVARLNELTNKPAGTVANSSYRAGFEDALSIVIGLKDE